MEQQPASKADGHAVLAAVTEPSMVKAAVQIQCWLRGCSARASIARPPTTAEHEGPRSIAAKVVAALTELQRQLHAKERVSIAVLEESEHQASAAYMALEAEDEDTEVGTTLLQQWQEIQATLTLRKYSAACARKVLKNIAASDRWWEQPGAVHSASRVSFCADVDEIGHAEAAETAHLEDQSDKDMGEDDNEAKSDDSEQDTSDDSE